MAEPTGPVLLYLLRTALEEGAARVVDRVTGEIPLDHAERLGHTSAPSERPATPTIIGWTSEDRLYLHPGRTAEALAREARRRGIAWSHSVTSLGALLADNYDLRIHASSGQPGSRTTVPIWTPGRRKVRVWDLALSDLFAGGTPEITTTAEARWAAAREQINETRQALRVLDRRLLNLLRADAPPAVFAGQDAMEPMEPMEPRPVPQASAGAAP